MPFNRPILTTLINRIVSDLNNKVKNSATFLRRSFFLIISKIVGGVTHGLYGFLEYIKEQIFISTADSEFLALHGNEFGKTRKVGTKTTGSGQITGTNGTVVSADTSIQSASGNVYVTDADVTIAGGIATVAFTAKEVGDAYDEEAGSELTFVSPLADVDTIVTIDSSGATGGVDEETDDEYRARLLLRKRLPPHGGTDFDYEDWALEVSGVTRAWSIPLYQGLGTIGLAFARDNDDNIIPTEDQKTTVYNYVLTHTDPVTQLTVGIPVTAEEGFFMIPTKALTVNFTIQISPNTVTVQNSVTERLQDLFRASGGAAETIALSEMYEALTSAVGENKSKIESPTEDSTAAVNQIHVLGDIAFGNYK